MAKNKTPVDLLLAPLMIAVLGGLQIYFFDVTFHGPDQIRDMEVARRLVHAHEWPVNSPPMFGERITLPPGFYYLLALPLLLKDSDVSVFIAFGILFLLSALYLWRQTNQAFGPRCGLVYATLALPLFPSIYAHSAWAPALVITFSNVLLGLYIRSASQEKAGWFALPLVFFLLVQIHPSAAPLLAGLTLYVLFHRRILADKRTLASVAIATAATAVWLVKSGAWARLAATGAPAAALQQPGHGWLANFLDLAKWRDALLMPYSLVTGIQPAMEPLDTLAAAGLAVMLAGLGLCCVLGWAERTVRWILATLAIWLIVSMAFLHQGGFWHLDVIHPWLAVAAAYGWSRFCDLLKIPRLGLRALAGAVFAIALSSHAILYRGMDRLGKMDWPISTMFFPQAPPSDIVVPSYTYRHLTAVREILDTRRICQDQVAGLAPMAMREATSRYFEPACTTAAITQPPAPRYFIATAQDRLRFDFTKGIEAIAVAGDSAVYAPQALDIALNGKRTATLLSQQRFNYMTYLPAHLEHGLQVTMPPGAADILLRLVLRCSEELPAHQPGYWRLEGASIARPMITERHRYLSLYYYDLEWLLSPHGSAPAVALSSLGEPMHCDVSAIARTAAP